MRRSKEFHPDKWRVASGLLTRSPPGPSSSMAIQQDNARRRGPGRRPHSRTIGTASTTSTDTTMLFDPCCLALAVEGEEEDCTCHRQRCHHLCTTMTTMNTTTAKSCRQLRQSSLLELMGHPLKTTTTTHQPLLQLEYLIDTILKQIQLQLEYLIKPSPRGYAQWSRVRSLRMRS